jgi:hypothetical protein
MMEAGGMLADAGAPLFGRRTYADFHSFWPNQKDNRFTAVLDDMGLERSAKREFAVLLFLLCSRALEAAAQVPSPEDVVAFSADSHSTRQARQLGRPDVTRDDLSIILTTYELIPREEMTLASAATSAARSPLQGRNRAPRRSVQRPRAHRAGEGSGRGT